MESSAADSKDELLTVSPTKQLSKTMHELLAKDARRRHQRSNRQASSMLSTKHPPNPNV